MSLLKRVLFQVGDIADEQTYTLSLVSHEGHYISLRPWVDGQEHGSAYEWVFAGTKDDTTVERIDDTRFKQEFKFWFESNTFLNVPGTHRGSIHTLWEVLPSRCLKETGQVFPAGPGAPGVSFLELWQPLDPEISSRQVIADAAAGGDAKCTVFKCSTPTLQGLVIVVGKWAQGLLWEPQNRAARGISAIRAVLDDESRSWKSLWTTGELVAAFPTTFDHTDRGKTITVALHADDSPQDAVVWQAIE